MIVIAGRVSLLGFVFKPVSWLAGDSRLRQTFSLRVHLVERQSLSSICPSTIISYLRSLEASLSTSASRSIHQQKGMLRLIRRRCVLTQLPDILRPIRPVRPDMHRNVPYVLTQRRNVSYVLTQRRVLPTSRLPQIIPLVATSS